MALLIWLKRQVLPVARKEVIHMLNDPATLRMAIILPVLQLLIFGFAINMDIHDIPTALYNEDARSASFKLVEALKNTTTFDIDKEFLSKEEMISSIRRGESKIGIAIPANYTSDIVNGRPADFQVLIDGSDSNVASQGLNATVQLGTVLSQQIESQNSPVAFNDKQPINAVPHILYNPDLKTTFLIIPGLLGIVLLIVTVMLTSFSIVKEREQGTMDQLLVTPLQASGLMVGKILPYIILVMIDFNFILLVMVYVFGVPIRGDLWVLELAGLIFLMAVLGIGLFVSSFSSNQAQAAQIAQLTAFPSILLSGFVFQIESEPAFIKPFSYMLPVTYIVEISRGVIIRGASFSEMFRPLFILTLLSAFILLISIFIFKKRAKTT